MIQWKNIEIRSVPGGRVPYVMMIMLISTLFPFGWLENAWPGFGRVVGWLFSSELAHVAGHLTLFGLVGAVLLHSFPRLQTQPRSYVTLMLCLGLGQEILQLISFKNRGPGPNELFDLGVDLLAAGCAYWVYRNRVVAVDKPADSLSH